jgi:ABC-type Fe3+ transport system substrate-binding protein
VFPRTWTVGVVAALALVISASAGPLGWAYSIVYVAALAPGWPIGWALADRRHPGAWIIGSLAGYGLTAVAICLPMALGRPAWWAFLLSWAAVTALSVPLVLPVPEPGPRPKRFRFLCEPGAGRRSWSSVISYSSTS